MMMMMVHWALPRHSALSSPPPPILLPSPHPISLPLLQAPFPTSPSSLHPHRLAASVPQPSVSSQPIHFHQQQQQQQQQDQPASGKDAAWHGFAGHVSGEWDGYGADFSSEGTPQELPDAVVPEAFREWGVQVHDWQTQCPTLAEKFRKALKYRVVRLLPTVGCEADAATPYSFDERQTNDVDFGAEVLAFHVNGSFITVWRGRRTLREMGGFGTTTKSAVNEGDRHRIIEVEHCLVDNENSKFRVRILQQIAMQEVQGKQMVNPIMNKIVVHREKWESEFRNGELLGGCATSGSAFATSTALQISDLEGSWHVEKFCAKLRPSLENVNQLVHEGSEIVKRGTAETLVLLPTGLWSELNVTGDDNFLAEAGWLVNADTAIVSNCVFGSDGRAKKVVLRFERRRDDEIL